MQTKFNDKAKLIHGIASYRQGFKETSRTLRLHLQVKRSLIFTTTPVSHHR